MLRSLEPASANRVPAAEKQGAALASVVTSAVLVALKLVVGLSTHSLGILSEAAHSSLDLVAAGITYFSVRVSDKPADREHPFGHGKVESLAAFVETGLLLVTCVWIVAEALKRLFFRSVHVEPTVWAFAIMLLSITLDTVRARSLSRVPRKYSSPALEADAIHFSMDIWSTCAVILGLVLVEVSRLHDLQRYTGLTPWRRWWSRDSHCT